MNLFCSYLARDVHRNFIKLELQGFDFRTDVLNRIYCSLSRAETLMLHDAKVNFLWLAVHLLPAYSDISFVIDLRIIVSICLIFNALNLLALLFDGESHVSLVDAWDAVADVDFLAGRGLGRHDNAHSLSSV